MRNRQRPSRRAGPRYATIGYAANGAGAGIVYVRASACANGAPLRAPFSVERNSALREREICYAALQAVATNLLAMGHRHVVFRLDDDSLIADVHDHRDVPAPLLMSYVRLGCVLNQFTDYRLEPAGESASELTAIARTEVHLNVAA